MTGTAAADVTRRFLNAYNRLDEYLRRQLGRRSTHEGHADLIGLLVERGDALILQHRGLLQRLAKLRNVLVHNPMPEAWDPIADPHPDLVAEYERVVQEVLEPPTALEHAVREVFATAPDELLLPVLTKMAACGFSQVPLLDGGVVRGVLTEGSLIAHAARHRRLAIDEATRVSELGVALSLDRDANERFLFVSPKESMAKVAKAFQDALPEQKRISAVFVTTKGRRRDRLLGLLTAWDVAGSS